MGSFLYLQLPSLLQQIMLGEIRKGVCLTLDLTVVQTDLV